MTKSHPDDLTLADYVDGLLDDVARQRVSNHLIACRSCSADARRIKSVDLATSGETTEPVRLPAGLLSAVTISRTTPFEAGQVWRIAWEGRTALVVTTGATEGGRVPAVAATAAETEPGPGSLDLSHSDHGLGFSLRIYPGAALSLPGFVFDIVLAESVSLPELPEPTELHPLDPVRVMTDALAELLDCFAQARWMPTATEPYTDLASLAKHAGVKAKEVAESLGISISRAVQLLRGAAEPTDKEQPALAALLQIDKAGLHQGFPQLDESLIRQFDNPGLRPRLQARARRLAVDEASAMRDAALAAYRPAARRAGGIDALDWRQILDDVLSAEAP